MPFSDFRSTLHMFVLMAVLPIVFFGMLGVFRWIIRSTNQRLFMQLLKGTICSSIALVVVFFLLPSDKANPCSVVVIYGLFFLLSTATARLVWWAVFAGDNKGESIAIYGAGSSGQGLVGFLENGNHYRPVLIIAGDPALVGSLLSGFPIVSDNDSNLSAVLAKHNVSKDVLAMPGLSASHYHRKIQKLEPLGLPLLKMPVVDKLMKDFAVDTVYQAAACKHVPILEGGPITLTHLDVIRYFMTNPDASQLVLQTSAPAKGVEVFVLDMGEPVRIAELGATMVYLFKKKLAQHTGNPNDTKIVVEGLRPGEKLYEELSISDTCHQTEVAKISCAKEIQLLWDVLQAKLLELRHCAGVHNLKAIRSILLRMVFLGEARHGDVRTPRNGHNHSPIASAG